MFCPILSIKSTAGVGEYVGCQKERCAWYCTQDAETGAGACAIWNIAMCLQLWREDEAIKAEHQEIKVNSVFKEVR